VSTGTTHSHPAWATPLEHLGDDIAAEVNATVHVRGPSELFGLSLERALFYLDLFKEPGRMRILEALPRHYSIPLPAPIPGSKDSSGPVAKWPGLALATKKTKRTEKESQ
jgi:hypothetical protein